MTGIRTVRPLACAALALAAALSTASSTGAQAQSVSAASSFRVGTAGVVCKAQYRSTDPRLQAMFDRSYRVVCTDAAAPVADLLVLTGGESAAAKAAEDLVAGFTCKPAETVTLPAGGQAEMTACTDPASGIGRVRYRVVHDRRVFLAGGFAGYDPAIRLALASLIANRRVPGTVEVASTLAGDPAAFARVRAGALTDATARAEAYELNTTGSFSEADAFFERLAAQPGTSPSRAAEFLANRGLQQANLGNFEAADALLERATRLVPRGDGMTQRLIRNYRAITRLNDSRAHDALAALSQPVAPVGDPADFAELGSGVIDEELAREINRENRALQSIGGIDARFTERERTALLDAQAEQLRGTAYRLLGRNAEARTALRRSIDTYSGVHGGRVATIAGLLAQARQQLALAQEAEGDVAAARATLQDALVFLQQRYPETPAPIFAKGWLAGLLSRHGQEGEALALYRQIIDEAERVPQARPAMKDLLAPYFAILGARAGNDPTAAGDLYRAAQLLQRPGVAQTQSVMAREMSSGDGEAAALFRLSLIRSRAIAKAQADISTLSAVTETDADTLAKLAEARQSLEELQREQTGIQAKLAEFPQYRTLTSNELPLADLQAALGENEAYYKVSFVGDGGYAQLIGRDYLRSFRLDHDRTAVENLVANIRGTIARNADGQIVTDPFDIEDARELYLALFGPVQADLAKVTHLIYEPDGPLLILPPTLLPQDQASVDAYLARAARPNSDRYDFRGVNWLGRTTAVSTSVSQRAFADLRKTAPSTATREYLGLGENALPETRLVPASYKTAAGADDCLWPLDLWRRPISASELMVAQSILGAQGSRIVSGAAFTDTALLAATDLADYRIVHFATHGLVTAPSPSCPARPALVTSFGAPGQSDGLLSFNEIFNLRLNADLVVLSACDTAGQASQFATREAGLGTGGGYALDGLVRAFTGAGARSVLASHWPVPDDFDATKKLITGMLSAAGTLPTSEALHRATVPLMDDAATSHPFYWAAFILVGDGRQPLRR